MNIDLSTIICVQEISDFNDVNTFLDHGWIIINTFVKENEITPVCISRTLYYSLGWSSANGPINWPEKLSPEYKQRLLDEAAAEEQAYYEDLVKKYPLINKDIDDSIDF